MRPRLLDPTFASRTRAAASRPDVCPSSGACPTALVPATVRPVARGAPARRSARARAAARRRRAPVARLPLALLTVALFALAGPARAAAPVAALRLGQLSPDGPEFDLLIDGKLTLRDVAFGEVSGYLQIAAGTHDLKVFPHRNPSTGDTSGNAIGPIEPLAVSVQLEAGAYYTLALVGYFDPPPPESQLGALQLELTPGTAVEVSGPHGYGVRLSQSATLPKLRPGEYTVRASRQGYQTAAYQVQVESGQTATVAISLQRGGGGQAAPPASGGAVQQQAENTTWHKTQLQLYRDHLGAAIAAGTTWVRIVHGSPTTPAVSLSGARAEASPEALVDSLAYPNATDYLALPAGRWDLSLTVVGTDLELSRLPSLPLEAGTVYTLFLLGNNLDNHIDILPTVDAVVGGAR